MHLGTSTQMIYGLFSDNFSGFTLEHNSVRSARYKIQLVLRGLNLELVVLRESKAAKLFPVGKPIEGDILILLESD